MASPQDEATLRSIEIVPFDGDHLEGSASRVSARFRAEGKLVQCLPGRLEGPERIVPLLHDLAREARGAVVVRDGVWTQHGRCA
jgi:hypothetical protein